MQHGGLTEFSLSGNYSPFGQQTRRLRTNTERDEPRARMERADKAEGRRAERPRDAEREGERDVTPPSPIRLANEAGVAGEFELPDPQELRKIESDTQSRLKAILEVAGVTGLSQIDAQTFQDPEILRKLTNRFVISSPQGRVT